MRKVETVGLVGGGVIGAGWAARCISSGIDVLVFEPKSEMHDRLRESVQKGLDAIRRLTLSAPGKEGSLGFVGSIEELATNVDFVQESAPENEELKMAVHAQIDAVAAPDVIIASSTSGILPTLIQSRCKHPERVIIGHPFNPVYLLPLVEIVGGEKKSETVIQAAAEHYRNIGMKPLICRKEVPGFIADRLQEALWRENLHMLAEGVGTTEDLDDSIIYGPGLRWAIMGSNQTYHLAGGEQGMRHFMEQFGPALKWPWTKLEAPELTDELIDRVVDGTEAQAAGRSIRELEKLRDDCLIGIMQTLRNFRTSAGLVLAENEERAYGAKACKRWSTSDDVSKPLELYECNVRAEWVDYNNHMSESFFLLAAGDASDALFRYIGDDEAYREAGHTFFTAESHINFVKEASVGEPLKFTTQLLGLKEKKLHFLHSMYHAGSGELLCAVEQMLIHVNTDEGKACPILPDVYEALQAIWTQHQNLPQPERRSREMSV
jgi:carnitine 3-dehydrogenase